MRDVLRKFLTESNRIEGIFRGPTEREYLAAGLFLALKSLALKDIQALQSSIAPGMALRNQPGMDVRVGNYIAPRGGPAIVEQIESLLLVAQIEGSDPWVCHCVFEQIHPFMDGNGRTGRMLWAWQMLRSGKDPFALPFLHRFYYQTLESVEGKLISVQREVLGS